MQMALPPTRASATAGEPGPSIPVTVGPGYLHLLGHLFLGHFQILGAGAWPPVRPHVITICSKALRGMPWGLKKVTPGSVSTQRHFLGLPIVLPPDVMVYCQDKGASCQG